LLFTSTIAFVSAPLNQWAIRRDKGAGAVTDKGSGGFPVSGEVIEEYPSDAPRLISVRQPKVLVAPPLESTVICHGDMPCTDVPPNAVEMYDVLSIRIVGGKVGSSSKPIAVAAMEISPVPVHAWNHGVTWVNND
jgi:hypothetical protein